ncbi:MAG: Hsp70 family protein [Pirellulales bacterium]|nr:Hsp70 family protein [Pirellulales bacterium]
MSKPKAVGIDLGTTFSVVAWVNDQGRTEVLRNTEGEILTPSIVLFEDAEVVVGKDARGALGVHPERVADFVKRDMGAPVYGRPIRGEFLPPEVIQACILRKLKTSVLKELGTETRVVITVPAYFDEPRRKATADAGEMAGLTLLDIVNEPTAAALAFGETLGYLSPEGGATEEMTIFVYDLGGGTFDATLLRLAPGEVRALATDGDVQLGGHDWDLRLAHYVAEEFKNRYGADPREDLAAFNRLYGAVLDAKHALTARARATVRVDFAGHTADVTVTREQFEELTADLLERTAYTTRQMIAAAGLKWTDVSRVLLVGGATRMPMVQRMLSEMTGIIPDHTVNPDEAVARGAALYAHYLLAKQGGDGPGPTFEVVNVNAHSLGVEGIDPQTLRKINVVLIPRNTALPAKVTEKFTTKAEGQRSIAVKVLEGESSTPSECTLIGRTSIRDLPAGLPKAWPIEVTFEYGTNGRLGVHAVVPGTHREVSLDLERDSGMSSDNVSRWRQAMSTWGGFVDFQGMLQEVLAPDRPVTPPEMAAPVGGLPPPAAAPIPLTPRPAASVPPDPRRDLPTPPATPAPPTLALPPGMAAPAGDTTQDFSSPAPAPIPATQYPTTQYWAQPMPIEPPAAQGNLSATSPYLPGPPQAAKGRMWSDAEAPTGQYLPDPVQLAGAQPVQPPSYSEDYGAPTGQYLPSPSQPTPAQPPAPTQPRPLPVQPQPGPYFSQPMPLEPQPVPPDPYLRGPGRPPEYPPYPQPVQPQPVQPYYPQQATHPYPPQGYPGLPQPTGYPQQPVGDYRSGYPEPFGVDASYHQGPPMAAPPPVRKGEGLGRFRIPMWAVTVIGYVLSAVIGITVGYLLINWLVPNSNILFW